MQYINITFFFLFVSKTLVFQHNCSYNYEFDFISIVKQSRYFVLIDPNNHKQLKYVGDNLPTAVMTEELQTGVGHIDEAKHDMQASLQPSIDK